MATNLVDTTNPMREGLIEAATALNNLYVIKTETFTFNSINANGGNSQQSRAVGAVAKQVVGVIGYTLYTGSRQNWCNVWKCYVDDNDETLYVSLCNMHPSSTATNVGIRVYLLCLAHG